MATDACENRSTQTRPPGLQAACSALEGPNDSLNRASADRERVDNCFQAGRHRRHLRRDSRYRSRNAAVVGLRICSVGYAVSRCAACRRDRIGAPVATVLDVRLACHVRGDACAFHAFDRLRWAPRRVDQALLIQIIHRGGALFGSFLYAVNMSGFTFVFPWFVATRDWSPRRVTSGSGLQRQRCPGQLTCGALRAS